MTPVCEYLCEQKKINHKNFDCEIRIQAWGNSYFLNRSLNTQIWSTL